MNTPAYPPGTVRALLETELVTPPTRRALLGRLRVSGGAHRFFDAHAFLIVRAACRRLVPQPPERHEQVDIAAEMDARLADGEGDGWRYVNLPPDAELHRRGVVALDATAQAMLGCGFAQALDVERDAVLRAVQEGRADRAAWAGLDQRRYFEELLALAVDIYYSNPIAQEEIGYVGMADAAGWDAIGLDEREPHEPLKWRAA